MWTTLTLGQHDYILATASEQSVQFPAQALSLAKGRVRAAARDQVQIAPDAPAPIILADVSTHLSEVATDIRGRYVAREELVEALELGLTTGQHVFVYGPPGSAKSEIVESFGQALLPDGDAAIRSAWSTQLHNQITEESLFGPIDPLALREGRWVRRLAGLARCRFATLDEFFKAAPALVNLALSALNERTYYDGEKMVSIPLLTAVAASNEVPAPGEADAVFDRFAFRTTAGYVPESHWQDLLWAEGALRPITPCLEPAALILLGGATELSARALGKRLERATQQGQEHPLLAGLTQLRELAVEHGVRLSDRRWASLVLPTIVASAQRRGGAEPAQRDLAALRFVIWQDPESAEALIPELLALTDPLAGAVRDARAMAEALRTQVKLGNFAEHRQFMANHRALREQIERLQSMPGIEAHDIADLVELAANGPSLFMEAAAQVPTQM